MNNYCIVIPHYNHHLPLGALTNEIGKLALPVIVVDDGSDEPSLRAVEELAASRAGIELLALSSNRGKGAAFVHGMQLAATKGYSHAVQIDADWQHCVGDMPKLIAESREHPGCIVSGLPIFGGDIPRSRLHGRKITLVLARIETLSDDIRDAMCGYRVYPIAPFFELCRATRVGQRMDFDAEVLVKACWRGQGLRFVPTCVRYPPDGVSHFQLFRDTLDLSLMHARLLLGMLLRLPRLLHRSGAVLPGAAESGR